MAIIISGKSHIVSMRSGVDKESEKNTIDELRLLSLHWFIRRSHRKLITRL